jgi:hypothetical protein
MADDSLSKLLPGTIEQYDRAARWSWVLLAVLATFHVTTFERFVDTSRDMARFERQLGDLADLSAMTKATSDKFKQEIAVVKGSTNRRVAAEFADLRKRFALLNLDVAEIRCRAQAEDPDDYEPCVEPAFLRAGLGPTDMQMQAQMPMNVQGAIPGGRTLQSQLPISNLPAGEALADSTLQIGGPLKLYVLPEDLAARITALPQRNDALIDLLEPLIEAELIDPVFDRLNSFWREQQLPVVTALAGRGVQSLTEVAATDENMAEAAGQSIQAAQQVKKAAQAVVFEPPDERRWWLTTGGKGGASDQLMEMVDSVADQGERVATASLNTILERLTQAEAARASVLESLKQAMRRLEESFKAQRAQLGALLEPLKAVAIDLAFFCRYFALIIALAGASAIVWPGEKLRVARLTARMAEDAGQDISVWRWFETRRRGVTGELASQARPFVLGGVLIVWSLYVANRLTGLEGVPASVWLEAGLGLVALLGAVAWRWHALRPI